MEGRQKQFRGAVMVVLVVWEGFLFFEFLMFGIDPFGLYSDGYSVDCKILLTLLEAYGYVDFLSRIIKRLMLWETELIMFWMLFSKWLGTANSRVSSSDVQKTFAGLIVTKKIRFWGLFLIDLFEGSEPEFLDGF